MSKKSEEKIIKETKYELIELIKESIREKVFSEGFIEMLKQEINKI
ncbi:MAG: hypothetical protein E7K85_15045 [Clostridium sp.]|nr:hypothetical protein [Clostridium sp.]MDU7461922.1 hypothetical protein [Clostridium sp.]